MKTKKTLALFISLLLVLLLFAGCGSPAPGSLPQEPPEQSTEQPGTSVPEAPAPKDQPAEDSDLRDAPPAPDPATAQFLYAHFIDVGQGDSILIHLPDNRFILIDGGPRAAGKTVVNYLKQQGVKELALVISTHPHEDHIGGLIEVLKAFPVKEVMDPAVVHTTKTFEEYLTLVDDKEIPFTETRAGDSRNLGSGIRLEILHPSSPSSNHLNDASIVAKITFNQISFLFAGDAEQDSEGQILLRSDIQPKANVLKVGHHGSKTSTTKGFLEAVSPAVAIISAGANNSYGHPHQETLDKLRAPTATSQVYRTDMNGTIVVRTDGMALDVTVEKDIVPYDNVFVTPNSSTSSVPSSGTPPPTITTTVDPVTASYAGSKNSEVFHYSTCSHVKSIKPENLVEYTTRDAAVAAGKRPCKTCNP
jgi:competence protein ComEC